MLAALADSLKLKKHVALASEPPPSVLAFGAPSVDAALPDGGLPRGAVVEIASPRGLARATSLALAACASAQASARHRAGDDDTAGAYCAWIDPGRTLFAPAVARAGVDLERLFVVRPPMESVARVATRVAASGVFSVIVIDAASIGVTSRERLDRWVTSVRRLALAVEARDSTVLLMTDSLASRSLPLPVAMRLELELRPQPLGRALDSKTGSASSPLDEPRLFLRVAKDRRGRVANATPIELEKKSA